MSQTYVIGTSTHEAPKLSRGLYITATPIGHLGDVSLRALATMAAADVLLCEDTRTTAKLLERYAIRTKLMPYHEHNAERVRPAIIKALSEGAAYALVSDAGMPLVSDPGYRLVADCVENNIAITSVPGASAVLAALALSGLPTAMTGTGASPRRVATCPSCATPSLARAASRGRNQTG